MRGSPIIKALVAFALLLALGYPLHLLLQPSSVSAAPTASKTASQGPVHLQITFTEAPRKLRVLSLGEPVWTDVAPALELERDLPIRYPKEGVDLQFEFDWPQAVRAAAQVRLIDPEGNEHTQLVWANGATTVVLTFQ